MDDCQVELVHIPELQIFYEFFFEKNNSCVHVPFIFQWWYVWIYES